MAGSVHSLGKTYWPLTRDYGLPTIVSLVAHFFNSFIIIQDYVDPILFDLVPIEEVYPK